MAGLAILVSLLLMSCGQQVPTSLPATAAATPCVDPACLLQTATPEGSINKPGLPTISTPELTPTSCAGMGCTYPAPSTQTTQTLGKIPEFSHVILIILENKEYNRVMDSPQSMPNFQKWAGEYALLTNYYGVAHPSLPNYLAMIGGDTYGIKSDCTGCFVNQPNLADQIETSGRTWKAYQEDMPAPCTIGNAGDYAQKHNPFIYFDSIRTDTTRCERSIVPLTQLDQDIKDGQLPNFSFITPNLCNDAHNCTVEKADQWLPGVINKIMNSNSFDSHSLIVVTFDEGGSNLGCCGTNGGGKVATILISPLVKSGTQDGTAYSHYSLLKTIEMSWGLPFLGEAGAASTQAIESVWK